MNAIDVHITKHCVISQLELLCKDIPVIKKNVFDWVVEMDRLEFNRLCCEIVSVYEFWRKYDRMKVSDDRGILQPYLGILPKVEIILRPASADYSQKRFYQWLQEANEFTLQDIFIELEMLWDHAIENINSYGIDSIFPMVKDTCAWWELNYGSPECEPHVHRMLEICRGESAIPV